MRNVLGLICMAPLLLAGPLLVAPLGGCANCGGDDDGMSGRDGSSRNRRDTGIRRLPDGRVVADDGSVPPGGSTDPCGGAAQRCCRSDACNLGLECDPGDSTCRSRPGGTCTMPSDCSGGLECDMGTCRVPDGAGCIGSSDCREGGPRIGGMCEEPTDACGAAGGMCCTGGICRSGAVCPDGGTTCESCGGGTEPCCDGATACGSTGSLLCIGGMCTVPVGCGSTGEPCCETMAGGMTMLECARGATCDMAAGMCMDAPAPGAPGSTCGADGQPCCPGDNCEFGSICEPFITNMCVGIGTIADLLGIECGREGQLCCFDREGLLPALTCEGDLECNFLFCSGDCGGEPSTVCTTADDCCDSLLCLPSPTTLRCCRSEGERCSIHLDCCGQMRCGDDETCSCRMTGETCVADGECCDGGLCITGMCRPASECRDPQEACMDVSECCRGFNCKDSIRGDGSEAQICCAGQETGCRDSFDCCGWMECVNGACECQSRGSECLEDSDCCEDAGDICVLGECVENTGMCGRVGSNCDPVMSGACCGSAACFRNGGATGPFQCCGRDGDPCEGNAECCGTMACGTDGTCVCRNTGESCIIGDCCGASTCNMPMMSANGTCS